MSHSIRSDKILRQFVLICFILSAFATGLSAHVRLDAPNGGEILIAGTTAEIRWTTLVAHNIDNWDLEYSVTGDGGPWLTIENNIPPGANSSGAEHTYNWIVPVNLSTQVRVRVVG